MCVCAHSPHLPAATSHLCGTDFSCCAGSSGYYRQGSRDPCEECGDASLALLSAFVALAGMILALVVFIMINRRAPSGLLRPFINLVQQLTVMLVRT